MRQWNQQRLGWRNPRRPFIRSGSPCLLRMWRTLRRVCLLSFPIILSILCLIYGINLLFLLFFPVVSILLFWFLSILPRNTKMIKLILIIWVYCWVIPASNIPKVNLLTAFQIFKNLKNLISFLSEFIIMFLRDCVFRLVDYCSLYHDGIFYITPSLWISLDFLTVVTSLTPFFSLLDLLSSVFWSCPWC